MPNSSSLASTVSKVGPNSFITFRLHKPPDLEQHRRIAEDLVAAYNSADPEAATRLNDLFHSSLNIEQIRDFIRDKLFNLPDTAQRINNFTLSDAQLVVARLYGFQDWNEFVQVE